MTYVEGTESVKPDESWFLFVIVLLGMAVAFYGFVHIAEYAMFDGERVQILVATSWNRTECVSCQSSVPKYLNEIYNELYPAVSIQYADINSPRDAPLVSAIYNSAPENVRGTVPVFILGNQKEKTFYSWGGVMPKATIKRFVCGMFKAKPNGCGK